jgi:hypothetical protein
MAAIGDYLYGFTDARFRPSGGMRGIADAPIRLVGFRDVAAVVSSHPVERLVPRRANLEPHHRIVRQMCTQAPLIPAAFGHISESDDEIIGVLRANYESIREELNRLGDKAEIGLKLCWTVENIFDYFVRTQPELRAFRDRIFSGRTPSFDDKLKLGSLFETCLSRERERLSSVLLGGLRAVIVEDLAKPPRDEKTICDYSMLIESVRADEFVAALKRTAILFDPNFSLQVSGPWPPYSFVRLQLQSPVHVAAA